MCVMRCGSWTVCSARHAGGARDSRAFAVLRACSTIPPATADNTPIAPAPQFVEGEALLLSWDDDSRSWRTCTSLLHGGHDAAAGCGLLAMSPRVLACTEGAAPGCAAPQHPQLRLVVQCPHADLLCVRVALRRESALSVLCGRPQQARVVFSALAMGMAAGTVVRCEGGLVQVSALRASV